MTEVTIRLDGVEYGTFPTANMGASEWWIGEVSDPAGDPIFASGGALQFDSPDDPATVLADEHTHWHAWEFRVGTTGWGSSDIFDSEAPASVVPPFDSQDAFVHKSFPEVNTGSIYFHMRVYSDIGAWPLSLLSGGLWEIRGPGSVIYVGDDPTPPDNKWFIADDDALDEEPIGFIAGGTEYLLELRITYPSAMEGYVFFGNPMMGVR